MNEGPLSEVELYAFEGASGSFRLTPHEFDVEIGNDTVVYPFNYLRRGTVVPPGSTVFPFTYR